MNYSYNANAIGLGGVIEQPSRRVVPSLASVALSPEGGEGTSEQLNYNCDGISFDSARTHVSGNSPDGLFYYTRAAVSVTNLNVFGRLQVASMSASLSTVREITPNGDTIDHQFSFVAQYSGLRADGVEIVPTIDTRLFDSQPTYDGFLQALAGREQAGYRKLLGIGDADVKALQPIAAKQPHEMPTIRCSLLGRGLDDGGYSLRLPELGRVHLAEVLLKPGQRRLTLLRFELDGHRPPKTSPGTRPPTNPGAPHALMALRNNTLFPEDGGGSGGGITGGSVEGNGAPTRP